MMFPRPHQDDAQILEATGKNQPHDFLEIASAASGFFASQVFSYLLY